MRRPQRFLEDPIRTGVVLLVAVAVVGVVVAYPGRVKDSNREASGNNALSFADREIAGGNGIVAEQVAAYAARALIPEDESYHVAVSPDYTGGDELTQGHVASYYRYFLMPRRPVEGARWIVCYGCDLTEYGEDADVIWEGDQDISIVTRPS